MLPLPTLPVAPPQARRSLGAIGSQTARARPALHVRKSTASQLRPAPDGTGAGAPGDDEEAPPVTPTEMSPAVALKKYLSQMSEYEKGEIIGYSKVYYCGQAASKISATFGATANNHGYDDDRGDYKASGRKNFRV
jgi:hypothetical protein